MSGIVAMVNADGAPVDEALLERMTGALAFRGPDARHAHAEASAGFGHAFLAIPAESESHDGEFLIRDDLWLTADMRLDDRETLSGALRAKDQNVSDTSSDAALLLAAYRAFGTDCVQHLRGDFAFAIRDPKHGRLFCARDHFGIKPLFYARTKDAVIITSSLEAIRLHPDVTGDLDEQAVAEFLAFGFITDTALSIYKDIHRLPPAHCLSFEQGKLSIERYWQLPRPDTLRYRHAEDYRDRFRALLDAATVDRVRGGKAAVLMSGGLDSTSVAASVMTTAGGRNGATLKGLTSFHDRLIQDDERTYTEIAARHLGIDVNFIPADAPVPFADWGPTPEPLHSPCYFGELRQYAELLSPWRVALSGHGADELLARTMVADLVGHEPALRILADTIVSMLRHRRRPAFGLRALMNGAAERTIGGDDVPRWIRPELAARFELKARAHALRQPFTPYNPARRDAYRRLSMPGLPAVFALGDPNLTKMPVEYRYPYFDLRLVEYLLAIPPIPWCIDKLLIRESMRGRLPAATLARPKTPLAEDPLAAGLRASNPEYVDNLKHSPELEPFIDANLVPDVNDVLDSQNLWESLTPASLALWFQYRHHKSERAN